MLGKFRHYLSKIALTHKSPKPSLYPPETGELDSDQQIHAKKGLEEMIEVVEVKERFWELEPRMEL